MAGRPLTTAGEFVRVMMDVAAIIRETSAGQSEGWWKSRDCFSTEVLIVTSESSEMDLTKIVS